MSAFCNVFTKKTFLLHFSIWCLKKNSVDFHFSGKFLSFTCNSLFKVLADIFAAVVFKCGQVFCGFNGFMSG